VSLCEPENWAYVILKRAWVEWAYAILEWANVSLE